MSIKHEWLAHPVTKELLADLQAEAAGVSLDLLSAGLGSTDPVVCRIAGQLNLLKNLIQTMSETETTNDEEENTQ